MPNFMPAGIKFRLIKKFRGEGVRVGGEGYLYPYTIRSCKKILTSVAIILSEIKANFPPWQRVFLT
jgi:hypothetical protein